MRRVLLDRAASARTTPRTTALADNGTPRPSGTAPPGHPVLQRGAHRGRRTGDRACRRRVGRAVGRTLDATGAGELLSSRSSSWSSSGGSPRQSAAVHPRHRQSDDGPPTTWRRVAARATELGGVRLPPVAQLRSGPPPATGAAGGGDGGHAPAWVRCPFALRCRCPWPSRSRSRTLRQATRAAQQSVPAPPVSAGVPSHAGRVGHRGVEELELPGGHYPGGTGVLQ